MTISDVTTRKQHQGNAAQIAFPYDWKIWAATDLKVYYLNSLSVEVLLSYPGDYTIDPSGIDNPAGGNIDLVAIIPALGEYITIVNDQPYVQTAAYIEGDDFPAAVHEAALDKQCRLAQQNKETESRNLTMAPSTPETFDSIIPAPVADYCLVWDTDGLSLVNKLFANSGGEVLIYEDHTSIGRHITYGSFAALRLTALVPFDGQIFELSGSGSAGDGGGGPFLWDSVSVVADDDIENIKIDSITTGRAVRLNAKDLKNTYAGDHSLPKVIDHAPDGSAVRIDGKYDVAEDGVIATSKILNIHGAQIGITAVAKDFVGDWIDNSGADTVDSPAIALTGVGGVIRRSKMKNFGILSEAPTAYAIELNMAIETLIDELHIECNSLGYGGIICNTGAYFTLLNHLKVKGFAGVGFKITGDGSEHVVLDPHITSTVDGSIGVDTDRNGTKLYRGEYSVTGTGSVCVRFYTTNAGVGYGGVLQDAFFEGISSGGYGVVVDGSAESFKDVKINNLRVDLNSNQGICVRFLNARYCKCINPEVNRYASGGTLIEWGANSVQCELICTYLAALAPIIVNAGATRAVKRVTGLIARTEVAAITTDANLTTILQDGVDALPRGFTPVHNGTAWNYHLTNLSNDDVYQFTPPSDSGIITLINGDRASLNGQISYNHGILSCELIGAGSDIEVSTTDTVAGDSNINKVTISAVNDGDIYLINRYGSNNFTVLIESREF